MTRPTVQYLPGHQPTNYGHANVIGNGRYAASAHSAAPPRSAAAPTIPDRPTTRIVRLDRYADPEPFSRVNARAFVTLPQAGWLGQGAPDTPEWHVFSLLGRHFRLIMLQALRHGHIDVTVKDETPIAVAVWFHNHGPRGAAPWDGYDDALTAALGPYAERFRVFDRVLAAHHPTAPHHHLALLAVDPAHQGQGHGTELIRVHLDSLRPAGIPVYLEAATAENAVLYRRLGFRPTPETIQLPDGPEMWPMWRRWDETYHI